jgi:NAD(P)-dependent dehydrogenase (short-subunit alcohol dehydrogenase family)
MAKKLEGQVAYVTGAASGNGRAIALCLAEEGAKVLCVDMQEQSRAPEVEGPDPTHVVIEKNGGTAMYIRGDVTSVADVRAIIETAVTKWGRLDIAVNKFVEGPLSDAIHVLQRRNLPASCQVCRRIRRPVAEDDGRERLGYVTTLPPTRFSCPVQAFVLAQSRNSVIAAMRLTVARYAIQQMRGQEPRQNERRTRGTVINLASSAGLRIEAVSAAYCTSKVSSQAPIGSSDSLFRRPVGCEHIVQMRRQRSLWRRHSHQHHLPRYAYQIGFERQSS